eukprot:Skav229048  [mRNA]  locus=scaffold2828:59620:59916:- [translate_table: standard]
MSSQKPRRLKPLGKAAVGCLDRLVHDHLEKQHEAFILSAAFVLAELVGFHHTRFHVRIVLHQFSDALQLDSKGKLKGVLCFRVWYMHLVAHVVHQLTR